MKLETIGPWKVSYDKEMTEKIYQSIKRGSTKTCVCADCKNYHTLMESGYRMYPDQFIQILNTPGVDYSKDADLNGNGFNDLKFIQYQGIFHFIGSIESADFRTERLGRSFKYWLTKCREASFDEFDNYPIVQIEFTGLELPWILEEDF